MKQKGNRIGWCDITVNPVTGCPNGCEYCYARSMNERFGWVEDFSKPQFFPHRLKDFRTKEPMIIFIDSMSDIGTWNEDWLYETMEAMHENPKNIYLALTKKMKGYRDIERYFYPAADDYYEFPKNFYVGATVTSNAQAREVIEAGGADFISFEPLLERIEPELLEKLRCKWWIVGDLTKNGKPQGVIKPYVIFDMAGEAEKQGIPFFMKESLRGLCGSFMRQQFPAGWRT